MNLVGPLFEIYLRRLDRQLRRAAADPGRFQRRLLGRLVRTAKDTWFGREHDFASIESHADYALAVPPADYVQRLDLYERAVAGEPDVLWPGQVRLFSRTSGTTAGCKVIPFTAGSRRNQLRAGMAVMAYAGRAEPGLVRHIWGGKVVMLGGRPPLPLDSGGVAHGIADIGVTLVPWPLRRHMEPGKLSAVDPFDERIDLIARHLVETDVRFIGHIPLWVVVLFKRVCELRGVDPEGGVSRVWPEFRVYCHGGMDFRPYRERFDRFFAPGHRVWYQEVYPSTEGFIAIQADLSMARTRNERPAAQGAARGAEGPAATHGMPGMELLTDNEIVFEFVPLQEWGKPGARRLLVDEVETGVPYCLLLTTSAGLWAYDIGDVVRFLSVKPPRIVFAGRHVLFLNAFGEHMIGEEVAQAVAVACEATGARVEAFTAAPVYPDQHRDTGCHQYLVEFEQEPEGGVEAFGRELDRKLLELNLNYRIKRDADLRITKPQIVPVPRGTFYEWMKRRGRLGGQNKIPVCANDRRFVDEILPLAEEMAAGWEA